MQWGSDPAASVDASSMPPLYLLGQPGEPPDSAIPGPDPRPVGSLPFDRRRRLGGDVVDDAIDDRNLVHDPAADPSEDVVRELGPAGRHPVLAGHGPDRHDVGIGPA